jgi:hypothetical protein
MGRSRWGVCCVIFFLKSVAVATQQSILILSPLLSVLITEDLHCALDL